MTLKDRLKLPENISGIFNWVVEGLKKFRAEGLKPPKIVVDATAEYQQKSDKMGNFISDCLEKSYGANCKALDVYKIYQQWCELNVFGCENKENFFDEMRTKNMLASHGTVDGVNYKNVVKNYIIVKDIYGFDKREPHNANDKTQPKPTNVVPGYHI